MELVAYVQRTIESESVEISEEMKAVVRSRAAELEADPSVALTTNCRHGWRRAALVRLTEIIRNVSHY
jgi:hypothetical protein